MFLGPPALPPDPPAAVAAPAEVSDQVQDGAISLTWTAPEGCSSAANLQDQLHRYLTDPPGNALSVMALVEPRSDAWHLQLSMERPGQTTVRQLDAPNCEMLTKAAALVVAVHVDVVGTSQGVRELVTAPDDFLAPDPKPPDEPGDADVPLARSTTPVPETVAIRTRRLDRRPRRRPPERRPSQAGILRLVGNAGVGERPGFFGGVGLAGGYQLRTFRIELQVDYTTPRIAVQPNDATVSATFQAVHGTVRGCWVSGFERWEFPLCSGVRAGALRGNARTGADQPSAAWSSSVSLTAEPSVVWSPIPELGIYGGLGLLVAMRRPAFRVGLDREPIYTAAPIGLQLGLGLELKLF